jgi:hypothetical protein
MKVILKILAAPFALICTLLAMMLAFVHSMSKIIFGIASGLVFICSVILLVTGETGGGLAFMAVAFLVSPYGLYALAGWLVDKLGDAGGALRGFMAR